MSRTVPYLERLNDELVQVSLPDTRKEAWDIYHEITSYADKDPDRFKAAVRLWTASDLYICGLFHTFWQRRDPWFDRPEVDCDFQFDHARWNQFEGDGALNYSARRHGKTSWNQVKITQKVANDPDLCVAIFSADKKLATKYLVRWKTEIETNAVLKLAWDDVFYQDPLAEGAFWSVENGLTVKRRLASVSPTLSAYTFMAGLPDGSRFGVIIFTDIETDKTVEAEEQRDKLEKRFRKAQQLAGTGCEVWMEGTFKHPAGLLHSLIKERWPAVCFRAEDTNFEPPDIAAIFDECNGEKPSGAKIPLPIRDVKLRGRPPYLHPIECAIARWRDTDLVYEAESMGDPLAGQVMRFRREWVADSFRVKADLHQFARGKVGYLLSDPSKGLRDPSVGILVVTDSDRTITIVDAFRKKATPSEWEALMYGMVAEWQHEVDLRQIRVEIYGQATWDHNLRSYFAARNFNGPPIYGVGTHMGSKPDQALFRAWSRLEPLFRSAKLRLPSKLIVLDEKNNPYDFIEYFLAVEYDDFPLPKTDDILATLSLLGEPEDKVPALEFPDRIVPWLDEDGDGDMMAAPPMPGIDEESFLWA